MEFKLYSKDQDFEETIFVGAMWWRIIYGAARVFLGYKLLSLVGMRAVDAYQHLFRRELVQDPDDSLLHFVGHTLGVHGFAITYFLAGYLLFWGLMDIILSVSMLRHYLWAFSVSLVIMTFFIAYEIYRLSHTHSHALFGFILVDAFIVFLIYNERGRLIRRRERKLRRQRERAAQTSS